MLRSVITSALLVASLGKPAGVAPVMNNGGVPYTISNPPGSTKDWVGQPGTYSTNFNANVKGPVEHFDVYGEVRTKYSQVYWTRNAPITLPPQLVERFKGKVMAITGYEIDQVTHSGPQVNSSTKGDILGGFSCYPDCGEGDKSVPSYNAYNHHYFSWLVGKDAEVYERESLERIPNPTQTGIRNLPHEHDFPTNIVFKENPGGEYRKSYHGYPSGYAQLVHSPTTWLVEPMQIDTHNRDYDINDEVGYKPAFLPKMQQNNMTDLQSGLSPLIECPCSNRIARKVVETSEILTSGTCNSKIASQALCTKAVAAIATVTSSSTVSNASLPAGCIMVPGASPNSYEAVFNTATSTKTCSSSEGPWTWDGPSNSTQIDCTSGGCLPSNPKYGCTGEFQGQCTWDDSDSALKGCAAYDECMGIYCSARYGEKRMCFGRSVGTKKASVAGDDQTWAKVYKDKLMMRGEAQLTDLVQMAVSHDGDEANISMSGPDGAWFGVGFGATAMDGAYAIIIDGSGTVSERKLGSHAPGAVLKSSITVVSSTVAKGTRTVVLTRPVAAATPDHFAIPTTPGKVDLIAAVGDTTALAYHKAHTGGAITLIPTRASSCICAPHMDNYLIYMNKSVKEFNGYNCYDAPRSDMKSHGDGTGRNVPNAACSMPTYHGGLQCCTHKTFLTDLEDDHRIPNKTDTYFLKWRYYFQEYELAATSTPATHQHLHHWVFLIDQQVNDYEEDSAHYGKNSVGKITANLTARDMGLEDIPKSFTTITPLVMTPHCHAPSCIREELWNADTGEIICNVTAKYGSDEWGATSKVFNEANYIAIPPCIFGAQPGLQKPFSLTPKTRLAAVKYFNNTYRHLGQMAQWTGLMVYDNDPPAGILV